jgi:hypothetical protein
VFNPKYDILPAQRQLFMIISHNEKASSNFKGTIIDIETIGDFSKYDDNDSRQYHKLTPTILGYITKDELNSLCAKGIDALEELKEQTVHILPSLKKPLFAFQSRFERAVFHHSYKIEIKFDGELNNKAREWKGDACSDLGIPNYDDPFNNVGKECNIAWIKGNYDAAIKHNRSCLLKERDILLKRNYRKPDELKLF